MKKEVSLKFRMPKDEFKLQIFEKAEEMHSALLEIRHFLFDDRNRDWQIEDLRTLFTDAVTGLPL